MPIYFARIAMVIRERKRESGKYGYMRHTYIEAHNWTLSIRSRSISPAEILMSLAACIYSIGAHG